MKNILFFLTLCILSFPLESCMESNASTIKSYDTSEYRLEDFEKLNLVNSKSLSIVECERERQFYVSKGFSYISTTALQEKMEKNNWFIGESRFYIGEIPASVLSMASERMERFLSIRNYVITLPDGREMTMEEVNKLPKEDREWALSQTKDWDVLIVAPFDKFVEESIETKGREIKVINPDPILLIRVDYGYIELARW